MIKQCVYCGGGFEVNENNRNEMKRGYCSDICRRKSRDARKKNGPVSFEKVCVECGKTYIAHRCDSVTCGRECNYERNKKRSKETGAAYREKMRAQRLMKADAPKKRGRKKKNRDSLEDIQARAREMGLSYGMYMAQLYMQKGAAR